MVSELGGSQISHYWSPSGHRDVLRARGGLPGHVIRAARGSGDFTGGCGGADPLRHSAWLLGNEEAPDPAEVQAAQPKRLDKAARSREALSQAW